MGRIEASAWLVYLLSFCAVAGLAMGFVFTGRLMPVSFVLIMAAHVIIGCLAIWRVLRLEQP